MAVFAALALLAGILVQPNASSAAEPSFETLVAPSPTPVQVTPPPNSTDISQSSLEQSQADSGVSPTTMTSLMRIQSWLIPYTKGISIQALGIILLLIAVTVFLLYIRRRRRSPLSPLPTPSVPFLKSPGGDLYFRLDGLEKNGLIIGRGTHGVDLRIEETTQFVNTVSNQHARVYFDAAFGNVIIEDLDSTNGIFINGRRAPIKNLLKDSWVIGLGSVELTYHDGESDTGPLD
jgi:hypothetical protein